MSDIEAFVVESMKKHKIVGSAVTILNSQEVLLQKSYGHTSVGGSPVTIHTPFNIGSMTKSFTGLAILQMADNDILSLDDLVIEHIPDFSTRTKERSDQITIRHLLNHNSGFTQLQGNRTQSSEYNDSDALSYAVADYQQISLRYQPGEHYEYSNSNYQILGLLIERLTNQPYDAYLIEHLLEPLGMSDSGFTPTQETAVPHRYFAGIRSAYKTGVARTIIAQGGLYTSIADIHKYLRAMLTQDTTLVSTEGYEAIFDGSESGIAKFGFAGWRLRAIEKDGEQVNVYWHGGSNPGILASMFIIPDRDISIAILSNTNSDFAMYSSWPLCFGPVNMLVGVSPPQSSSLIGILLTLSWFIPLILIIMIIRRAYRPHPSMSRTKLGVLTVITFCMSYLLIQYIPTHMGNVYWKTVYQFEPETGLILMVTTVLTIVLMLVNWGQYLRTKIF